MATETSNNNTKITGSNTETSKPQTNTTRRPLINPKIIAYTLNDDKIQEQIREFLKNITIHDIRKLPDDDNNEVYFPDKPEFFEDKKKGKRFIIIKWKKFYEYKIWKKYTWFWYIYNEETQELYLAQIEKWKIITPYIIVNKYEGTRIVEILSYRDKLTTKVKDNIAKSLLLRGCLDLQSIEIVGKYHDNSKSEYLILRSPNLNTKEKEIICRKYSPNITWLAYKELGDREREIWFYKEGEPIETTIYHQELINVQDLKNFVIF